MRERHNIVGSEVGHARPPIYFQAAVRRRPARRRGRLLLAAMVLVIVVAVGGGALAYLEQGVGGEAARPAEVWSAREAAEN